MISLRSPSPLCVVLLAATLLAPSADAQDMTVRIDGEVVTSPYDFVFADTPVGESASVVVTLRNESSQDLVFTEDPPVILGGGFPEQFQVVQPALESGNRLSPNGSTAFRIDFVPTFRFVNVFTRAFIYTNAAATPFNLGLQGKATAPVLTVSLDGETVDGGTNLDFAPLASGAIAQYLFVVGNTGDAPLVFEGEPVVSMIGADAALFTIVQPALESGGVLSPNGSTAFSVRLANPLSENRTLDASLVIETNDLSGDFAVTISGVVVAGRASSFGALKARF